MAFDGIEIQWAEANHDFSKRWHSFGPSKEILPRGWQKAAGRRRLDEDLIFERDICITLRDGCKTHVDVFRPFLSEATPVPAILAWSPYGKQGNGTHRVARYSRLPHCVAKIHEAADTCLIIVVRFPEPR